MQRRLLPSKLSGMVWLGALGATALVTWFFQGARSDFRGIAEDAKQIVSSATAVEILSVDVQPGQIVGIGDTLVRLRNSELSLRIADILHDIEDASGDASINKAESQRRIAQIRADYQSRRAEYLGEIRTLEEQRFRNQSLVSGFRAMGVVPTDSNGAALQDRIKALQQQIDVEANGMNSQIALLEGTKGDISRLASSRNDALRAELALLREEESRLVIRSATNGVVDSINYRVGEKVSPFSPILTISGHRPILVRGYIQEKIRSDLRVGDSADVLAVGMRPAKVAGCVIGLGSRIIELPPRMWKVPNYPQWGREVIVRIAPGNPLLLGELVLVHHRGRRIRSALR